MNADEIVNPYDNSLSTTEEEKQLLFTELILSPSFRHDAIIADYLSGTAEEVAMKRERLEVILMYLRNSARIPIGAATLKGFDWGVYSFPAVLADRTLEILHKFSAKRRPPKRKAKHLTLKGLFNSQARNFKSDFKKVINERNHRSRTETFQLIIHYFWANKKDFPRMASPLTRLFIEEFGNQIGNKLDTLRKDLKFDKNSDIHIPSDISNTFEKYTK